MSASHDAGAARSSDLSDLPVYHSSLWRAVSRFWRKYATFDGRASRSEFWWWALVDTVLSSLLVAVAGQGSGLTGVAGPPLTEASSVPYYVWTVATFLPAVALTVRRLHDANRSGLWLLVALVPVVGIVAVVMFGLARPDPVGVRYDRPVPVGS